MEKDHSDYPAITLLSSLGKLFNSPAYIGIENEIESKERLSPFQTDVRKKFLIKKATHKENYL